MTAALLDIGGLHVVIGARLVVDDLSLRLEEGEILGLVGASGSGKSMTALAIMQLLPAAAHATGSIRLRGESLCEVPEAALRALRGRAIGMVFQEPMTALNPLMRIGDQVAETVRLHGAGSAAQARAMARETLDAVGLTGEQGALERYPHELSGGQRQRVAIAIAVVLRPALLIADEPTTALDVSTQARVLALLEDLARTRRMGLILVSHDLAVIAKYADQVAVMHEGRIVERSPTAATLRDLRHPYARALLAAAAPAPKRAAAGGRPVLEARGVVREYATKRRSPWRAAPAFRAVDTVSLELRSGETVGLVGASGSGKSSLLRAILGLERLQGGAVFLLGEEFSGAAGAPLRRLRRSIQAVFQDPYGSFDPRWSVERLIEEPFHLLDSPLSRAERARKVAAVLEQVGLAPGDAARLPHEFSGGQRQRIAIARALVTEPAVIVLDEAVSALDVLVRAQVLELLAALTSRLSISFLFVSHDLAVVRAVADRIYVMQGGRIVEEGETERLFESPAHPYTQALIAAMPRWDSRG